MNNLTKRLGNLAKYVLLPITLALSPVSNTSAIEVNSPRQSHQYSKNLEDIAKEQETFKYEKVSQEENDRNSFRLQRWIKRNENVETVPKIKARLRSNKHPEEILYLASVQLEKLPGGFPLALTFDGDGVTYLIEEGANTYLDQETELLKKDNIAKTDGGKIYQTFATREFKDWVGKDFSNPKVKEQFRKYLVGDFETGNLGKLLVDALEKERRHRKNRKEGISIEESEDMALCLGILNGMTFENLGRAYAFAYSKKDHADYALYKRFVEYFESQRGNIPLKDISQEKAKEITKSYFRLYHKDSEDIINKN